MIHLICEWQLAVRVLFLLSSFNFQSVSTKTALHVYFARFWSQIPRIEKVLEP